MCVLLQRRSSALGPNLPSPSTWQVTAISRQGVEEPPVRSRNRDEEEKEKENGKLEDKAEEKVKPSLSILGLGASTLGLPPPSVGTVVDVFASCRKWRRDGSCSEILRLQTYLHRIGLDMHRSARTALLSLLIELGNGYGAQQVFDKLIFYGDASLWDHLIQTWSNRGDLGHAFDLFRKVQYDDNIHLSSATFVALLKACANAQDLSKGVEVHTIVSNVCFLETDVFIGSVMVDMYAKCGALNLAEEVFDNIEAKDVVSWTTLIGGYANHGNSLKALQCFESMQNEAVSPNDVTFSCVLKACADERDPKRGIEIHTQIEMHGYLETHVTIGNALLNMYAKFGLLCEAQKVFNKLPNHNVITWTTLVSAYVECGHGEEALKCLEEMRHQKVSPNVITFIWSLKACENIDALEESHKIHADIEKHGLGNEKLIANTLIDMYAKFGIIHAVEAIFEKLEERGVVSWTSMIAGYIEHSQDENAVKCFEQMLVEGVLPDAITVGFYMKSCSNIGVANKCEALHAWIEAMGLSKEGNFIASTLIELYGNIGMIGKAQTVLDKLETRDEIILTSLLTGYLKHGYYKEAFECVKQIQLMGVTLDSSLFICVLKACGSSKARDKGEEIHADIEKKGWLGHKHVGNALIEMYVKCGSVVVAQHVFDKLKVKDVVSWNTLISGYVEDGCCTKSLKYFELMQEQSVLPNTTTFIHALQSCGMARNMDKGCEIHSQIEKMGLPETDLVVGTALVDMYGKFGWLCEAHQVFNKLSDPDTISWTALITGYIEHGDSEKALLCCKQMQQTGISFNSVTLICGLKACGSLQIIGKGLEIHAEIMTRGLFEQNVLIGNTLVDMYGKCGFLSKAFKVFDELFVREVTTWNCLIVGYINCGHYMEALKCYEIMQNQCVIPNSVTYVCCLKVCGRLGALRKGLGLHAVIGKCGLLQVDVVVGNSLIDMYVKCNSFTKAQEVFYRLPFRDVVSWNVLIKTFIEQNLCGEALKCLKLMELEGVDPDSVTYVYSLKAYSSIEDVHNAETLHVGIKRNMLEKCASSGTTSVDIYAKCGFLSELQQVIHELPLEAIATWNSLIFRLAEQEHFEQALWCFQQMQLQGVFPNAITLSHILKVCASIGAINKGREVHSQLERKGLLETDSFLGNGLVDMYAKCGSLVMAHQVFDLLPVRDSITWTALMAGYAKHGNINVAFDCFECMQLEGVSPNAVTFLSCLKPSNILGTKNKSLVLHAEIEKMGLFEESSVGNILVGMYVKDGYLAIAQDIFYKLSVKDVISWNALIQALAENGKSEEALECFGEMRHKGFVPDSVTLLAILKACGMLGDANKGQEVQAEIEKMGLLYDDIVVGAAVIDMYVKCRSLSKALYVFDKLQARDVFAWNALIGGYAEHGFVEKALESFDEMRHNGISPSPVTFVCCLKACGSIGAKHKGQEIHAEIERRGLLETDLFIGNMLVDMYARCGLLAAAQKVSDKLSVQDVVTWNSLLTGYAQLGRIEDVFYTFNQMVRASVMPDSVSFLIVLSACSRSGFGFFEEFNSMYMETMNKDFGIAATPQLHNAMIALYCRAGQLDMAMSMLTKMPFTPDMVAWHALLYSCGSCGNVGVGKQAFQQAKCHQNGSQNGSG